MPEKLSISDLRPHVTLALFRTSDGGTIVDEILAQMESLSASLPRPAAVDPVAQKRVHSLGVFNRGRLTAKAAWYCIEHGPMWLGADAGEQLELDSEPAKPPKEPEGVLMDRRHELVVLLADAEFAVVHATQEAMRTRIPPALPASGPILVLVHCADVRLAVVLFWPDALFEGRMGPRE